jgi:hypothetical protein
MSAADAFFGVFGMTRVEAPLKLTTTIDCVLGRGQNEREHYRVRANRVKAEREATARALVPYEGSGVHLRHVDERGARVVLVRPYEKTKLDTDNLSGAFKGVRDEVAHFLGVDDATDRVHWVYEQTKAVQVGSSVKKGRTKASPDYDTRPTITIEVMPVGDIDPQVKRVRELEEALDRWAVFYVAALQGDQNHDLVQRTRRLLGMVTTSVNTDETR